MTVIATDGTKHQRVVSGMRSTGRLHLGNYHGALKNWIKLQYKYDCFFFAADWHALTTHYEKTLGIKNSTLNMIHDWLSAGLDPNACKLFIQSGVPEHAELHLLLSMIAPLGLLERVPTYKDQKIKLKEKDLLTYGFLGYSVLQSADVLLYKASYVPVGEDQVPHIELTRALARRFNYLYGKEHDVIDVAEVAVSKMGKKNTRLFYNLLKTYHKTGNIEFLKKGRALLSTQAHLSIDELERLYGFLDERGKIILPEPKPLLTCRSKFPGLDGRKMSKSYNNTIGLTESAESVEKKIKTMPTDPARVRRTDPGEPLKCPVWSFHEIYSTRKVQDWVQVGCRSVSIGCLDCKGELLVGILSEQKPILERAAEYQNNPSAVRIIVQQGIEKARDVAKNTLSEVRSAMGISYR